MIKEKIPDVSDISLFSYRRLFSLSDRKKISSVSIYPVIKNKIATLVPITVCQF